MSFLELLTTEEWISLIGAIATSGGAWATFCTVKEVKKQREASYKPDFVLRTQYAYAFRKPNSPSLIFEWFDQRPDAEVVEQSLAPPKPPGYSLSLLNVGLGAAKTIQATWNIDLTKWIPEIKALAQSNRTHLDITQSRTENSLQLSGPEILFPVTHMIANQMTEEADHLLPASLDEHGFSISLPGIYLTLTAIQCALGARLGTARGIRDPWSSIPSATLSLTYADIGGKRHSRAFDCRLELLAAGHENVGFHTGEWPTFLHFKVQTQEATKLGAV